MSNKIYVFGSFDDVETTPEFAPVSRVVVNVDDNTFYTAGDESGRTLTVNCPWGTQQIANDLLNQYRGYRYRPFEAKRAIIDQSAELGDAVQVGRVVYSGIYQQDIDWSSLPKTNFSAPQSEAINHEFPFKAKTDRKYIREFHNVRAKLTVQDGLISAEVKARTDADKELSGRIDTEAGRITAEVTARENAISGEASAREEAIKAVNVTLDAQKAEISAKVSQTGGAEDGSFSYEMRPTYVNFKANGASVLKLDKNGGKFTGDIEAENGYFHGTVRAANISFGEDDGYFDGAGIKSGTISGGEYGEISGGTLEAFNIKKDTITHTEVAGHTLGTTVFEKTVNKSLGYADFSTKAISENQDGSVNLECRTMTIRGNYLGIGAYPNNDVAQWMTKTIAGVRIKYLGTPVN